MYNTILVRRPKRRKIPTFSEASSEQVTGEGVAIAGKDDASLT